MHVVILGFSLTLAGVAILAFISGELAVGGIFTGASVVFFVNFLSARTLVPRPRRKRSLRCRRIPPNAS